MISRSAAVGGGTFFLGFGTNASTSWSDACLRRCFFAFDGEKSMSFSHIFNIGWKPEIALPYAGSSIPHPYPCLHSKECCINAKERLSRSCHARTVKCNHSFSSFAQNAYSQWSFSGFLGMVHLKNLRSSTASATGSTYDRVKRVCSQRWAKAWFKHRPCPNAHWLGVTELALLEHYCTVLVRVGAHESEPR